MTEIITERLIIRPFVPEDWEDLYEYLSDEEVIKYEPYETYSAEDSKTEALRRSTDQAFYAVCIKETRKVIGNIYFKEGEYGTWELGYVFNLSYQKKGYATEAARTLIGRAFNEGRARRVIAKCNPENTNSWRLMERLGMRREGYLKKNIYFKMDTSGKPIWQDTYEYAILAEEWK